MKTAIGRILIGLLLLELNSSQALCEERVLKRGPSPINNPLKGLVPYARPAPDRFPHSMEFNYLGLARLVIGKEAYDWAPLEEVLDDIASRGNQAVIRFYMEYPAKKDGIPKYLVEQGLAVHTYLNTNTAPFPPTEVSTPDYENEQLRMMLDHFVRELGKRYDGDARLAYITAGLLGTWGEWHTYPRNELWASKQTQKLVMDAYEASFHRTPVLLRYPAGENHYDKAPNASRRLGYHDDSLCWATLETGKDQDNWFFVPALKAAGVDAFEKWKSAPIGGEIRPEVWGKIFDDTIDIPEAQPFAVCAAETHLTWTMDTGMFREVASPTRLANAKTQVSKLGYEFFVSRAEFPSTGPQDEMSVELSVTNLGIAPLYHDWGCELAAVPAFPTGKQKKSISQVWPTTWKMTDIQPNDQKSFKTAVSAKNLPSGEFILLVRIVNPLNNGKPVQFANQEWATEVDGYLTLGNFSKATGQ